MITNRFIKLNVICGKPFYVRRNAIAGFHEHTRDGRLCVKLLLDAGEPYHVIDSIETVMESLEA